MNNVSHKAPKVKAIHKETSTPQPPTQAERDALDTRIALIQALIPLGLDAVAEELQNEVTRLAGDRYSRKDTQNPNRRWGSQQGSVYLADQKVPLSVPRVRNVERDEEVCLSTYHHLQVPRRMDEGLLLSYDQRYCHPGLIKPVLRRSPKPLACPHPRYRDALSRHRHKS